MRTHNSDVQVVLAAVPHMRRKEYTDIGAWEPSSSSRCNATWAKPPPPKPFGELTTDRILGWPRLHGLERRLHEPCRGTPQPPVTALRLLSPLPSPTLQSLGTALRVHAAPEYATPL